VGRRPARARAGRLRRHLTLIVAIFAAISTIGLTATSSAALNGSTYNVIQNAGQGNYCLDIDTNQPVALAPAQLWICTHGQEQHFMRLDGILGHTFRIKIERGGGQYCLGALALAVGARVGAVPCGDPNWIPQQSWITDGNGNLVDPYTSLCADTFPSPTVGFPQVYLEPCDVNSISQRWFL